MTLEDMSREMVRRTQINAMRGWFLWHYEDPAHETPYSGSDGGYFYIHGGPYDAEEELRGVFEGIFWEDAIMELVEELSGLAFEWAPTVQHPKYIP